MAMSTQHCISLDLLCQILKALGVVATAAAAVLAACEYLGKESQEQKNRTFFYLDHYRAVEMIEVRSQLATYIRSALEYEEESKGNTYLITTLSQDSPLILYDTLVEYFDVINACINTGGCDKDTAIRLFHDDAMDFYWHLLPVIDNRATENKHHGIGLKCLAAKYSTGDCKANNG